MTANDNTTAKPRTPPIAYNAPAYTHHLPPSAPTSPLAKRAKTMAGAADASTEKDGPAANIKVEENPPLLVKKLSDRAKTPTRGSAFAAGYDLYSVGEVTIPGRGQAFVDTDISIAVPAGTYGRVAPRSGLASKHSINTGAGVIDADYRGPVRVLLFNHSDVDFKVNPNDRIAQLILERILTPDISVVEELEESVRGAGGFGSTGV